MKKRIVSVVLAALFLIAAAAVPAGAVAPGGEEHVNACSHVWNQGVNVYCDGFISGVDGCYKEIGVRVTCRLCGAIQIFATGKYVYIKSHKNKLQDGGHSAGKHTYIYKCSDCHYQNKVTVTCPGPPCFLPEHVNSNLIFE